MFFSIKNSYIRESLRHVISLKKLLEEQSKRLEIYEVDFEKNEKINAKQKILLEIYEQEKESLEKQLQILQKECEDIKTFLESQEIDKSVQAEKFKAMNRQLKEIEQIKEELESASIKQVEALEFLKPELEKTKAMNNQLEKQLQKVKDEFKKKELELKELQQILEGLKEELDQKKGIIKERDQEIGIQEEKIEIFKKQLDIKQKEVQHLEADFNDLIMEKEYMQKNFYQQEHELHEKEKATLKKSKKYTKELKKAYAQLYKKCKNLRKKFEIFPKNIFYQSKSFQFKNSLKLDSKKGLIMAIFFRFQTTHTISKIPSSLGYLRIFKYLFNEVFKIAFLREAFFLPYTGGAYFYLFFPFLAQENSKMSKEEMIKIINNFNISIENIRKLCKRFNTFLRKKELKKRLKINIASDYNYVFFAKNDLLNPKEDLVFFGSAFAKLQFLLIKAEENKNFYLASKNMEYLVSKLLDNK